MGSSSSKSKSSTASVATAAQEAAVTVPTKASEFFSDAPPDLQFDVPSALSASGESSVADQHLTQQTLSSAALRQQDEDDNEQAPVRVAFGALQVIPFASSRSCCNFMSGCRLYS
jgi:hypothetical protein